MLFRWLQWFPGDIRGSTYYPTLKYLQKVLDRVPHYIPHMVKRCAQLMKNLQQELREALTRLTLRPHHYTGMWCHRGNNNTIHDLTVVQLQHYLLQGYVEETTTGFTMC